MRTPLATSGRDLPTVCVLCSHNCGIRVDVEDGRITKVVADDRNPITKGYLCNKAFSVGRYVEHDQRVRRGLDDPAHVGLAHPRPGRAVRVGDEDDAGVGFDRLDVGVDVDRHRLPVRRLVGEDGNPALGLGEQVVDREARAGHQDLPAG